MSNRWIISLGMEVIFDDLPHGDFYKQLILLDPTDSFLLLAFVTAETPEEALHKVRTKIGEYHEKHKQQ